MKGIRWRWCRPIGKWASRCLCFDATSGRETYGAARFLMGEDMHDGGITLDFNRAFTPPCAFTPFAICPLPPRQNVLPFAVTAGETWG
ncbi:MAG: DUF1684 domain-containing protein [Paracoccaceae bacterium]